MSCIASGRQLLAGILAGLFLTLPLLAKEAAPLAQDEAAEKRLVAISSRNNFV